MERLGCSCPKRQGQRACACNVPPARVYMHVIKECMYDNVLWSIMCSVCLLMCYLSLFILYCSLFTCHACVLYIWWLYYVCSVYVLCVFLSVSICISPSLFFPNAKRCWHLILRCIEIKMDYCRLGTNGMTWGFWLCVSDSLDNSVWTTVATDACFGSSSWTLLHFINLYNTCSWLAGARLCCPTAAAFFDGLKEGLGTKLKFRASLNNGADTFNAF